MAGAGAGCDPEEQAAAEVAEAHGQSTEITAKSGPRGNSLGWTDGCETDLRRG